VEIACSLRNNFRASLENYFTGVELLNGDRGLPVYLPQPNSEYRKDYLGSQTVRDNLHGREGNNPDRRLRPLSHAKFIRKSDYSDSQDVGLEAAII
jgi:hypothetical protein